MSLTLTLGGTLAGMVLLRLIAIVVEEKRHAC